MVHKLSDDLIGNIINSLKCLDVRGYDSMNILVGLVMLFEQILESPTEEENTEEQPN